MRSFWRTVRRVGLDPGTLRNITLVAAADGVVGLSFGAIAVGGGQKPWVPVSMSLLVFAGGAQFASLGIVLAGGGVLAAVTAGLVLNTRMIPYGFAVGDILEMQWPARVAASHVLCDETVAFTLDRSDPDERRAVYVVTGATLFVVWNLCVLAGALAGRAVGDPNALGLDAASPVVLLALVVPTLRSDRGILRGAVVGTVVALAVTPFLPIGLPVLAAVAGLAAIGRALTPPGDTDRSNVVAAVS
jgi:predicted branched-subunit amino acid permease